MKSGRKLFTPTIKASTATSPFARARELRSPGSSHSHPITMARPINEKTRKKAPRDGRAQKKRRQGEPAKSRSTAYSRPTLLADEKMIVRIAPEKAKGNTYTT